MPETKTTTTDCFGEQYGRESFIALTQRNSQEIVEYRVETIPTPWLNHQTTPDDPFHYSSMSKVHNNQSQSTTSNTTTSTSTSTSDRLHDQSWKCRREPAAATDSSNSKGNHNSHSLTFFKLQAPKKPRKPVTDPFEKKALLALKARHPEAGVWAGYKREFTSCK